MRLGPGGRLLRGHAVAILLVCSASSGAASAAAGLAQLDYKVDEDCPPRALFLAQVAAAVDGADGAAASAGDREAAAVATRIRVEIHGTGARFRGTMERIDGRSVSAPRVVVGTRCDDVAQALALTIALSAPPSDESAAPRPAAMPEPPAVAWVAAAPLRSVFVLGLPRAPSAPALQLASHPAGALAGSTWQLALGANTGAWLSPDLMAGLEAALARRSALGGGAAAWAWGLRGRASYARNDWRGNDPVARFGLLATGLEVCGHGRPSHGPVELGVCGGPEIGWLHGQGVHIALPRASDSLWLAAGGGPSLRIHLGTRWQIEARGVALRPLRHVRFAFDTPAQSVAETRGVAWIGALGVAAELP